MGVGWRGERERCQNAARRKVCLVAGKPENFESFSQGLYLQKSPTKRMFRNSSPCVVIMFKIIVDSIKRVRQCRRAIFNSTHRGSATTVHKGVDASTSGKIVMYDTRNLGDVDTPSSHISGDEDTS